MQYELVYFLDLCLRLKIVVLVPSSICFWVTEAVRTTLRTTSFHNVDMYAPFVWCRLVFFRSGSVLIRFGSESTLCCVCSAVPVGSATPCSSFTKTAVIYIRMIFVAKYMPFFGNAPLHV